jgi:AraC-like DNA-binding protein
VLAAPGPAGGEVVPAAVTRVQRLLEGRADEPLALDDLAREAGWSPGHLIKEFRRGLGLTPHAYLLQVRVEHARRRIAEGCSLVDAALASGFADQSHLNRQFKRVLGVTPGVFARGLHRRAA